MAFVPKDDAVLTGASDGKVYLWRDFKATRFFEAHARLVGVFSVV